MIINSKKVVLLPIKWEIVVDRLQEVLLQALMFTVIGYIGSAVLFWVSVGVVAASFTGIFVITRKYGKLRCMKRLQQKSPPTTSHYRHP